MKNYFKFFFVSIVMITLLFSISCTIKIGGEGNIVQSSTVSNAEAINSSESNTNKVSEINNNTNNANESTAGVNSSESVPLPTPEDIIRLFFDLINEKRIPEAINLMTDQMVDDDTSKQAWGVQFNAIQSIRVQNIEPSGKEQWTDTEKMFKVTLEVSVSPEAKDAPIPYYGWDTNPSIRWITVKKDNNGLWRIDLLATGP